VYIEYGTNKSILGFSHDMIKKVCVQYDEKEKSSWFTPSTQEVTFTENMYGHEQQTFDAVADALLGYNNDAQVPTLVALEDYMKHSAQPDSASTAYTQFFDMRIGTVLHETEHARRNKAGSAVNKNSCKEDDGHPNLDVSFCGEPSRNLSFDDCFKEVGRLISSHVIDGVSFAEALVIRWKQVLSGVPPNTR